MALLGIKDFHFRAGDQAAERREAKVKLIVKVIRFLKDNPLSTCEEVYKGCGVSVNVAQSWVTPKKYEGKTCYRVNWPKLRTQFGNTSFI